MKTKRVKRCTTTRVTLQGWKESGRCTLEQDAAQMDNLGCSEAHEARYIHVFQQTSTVWLNFRNGAVLQDRTQAKKGSTEHNNIYNYGWPATLQIPIYCNHMGNSVSFHCFRHKPVWSLQVRLLSLWLHHVQSSTFRVACLSLEVRVYTEGRKKHRIVH